jgi:hypothetical protein
MSEQPATKGRAHGTNKATRAAAGVAGALAFLGIGWAMGARSTVSPATVPAAGAITGTPIYPSTPLPGEWEGDDGQRQWGTIQLPAGLTPAQPGTGTVVPPTTGSGGSGVAATSVTTTNVTTGASPATGIASGTGTGTTTAGTANPITRNAP